MLKVTVGCGFRAEEDERNSSTFLAERKHLASCRTPPEGGMSFSLTHLKKKKVLSLPLSDFSLKICEIIPVTFSVCKANSVIKMQKAVQVSNDLLHQRAFVQCRYRLYVSR